MMRFASEDRFWSISVDDQGVLIRSGKHGTKGRSSRTATATPAASLLLMADRVAKKRREDAWTEVPLEFSGSVDLTPRLRGDAPSGHRARTPGAVCVPPDAMEALQTAFDGNRSLYTEGLSLEGQPESVVRSMGRALEQGVATMPCTAQWVGMLMALFPRPSTIDALVQAHGLVDVLRSLGNRDPLRARSTLYARGLVPAPLKPTPRAVLDRVADLVHSADDATWAELASLAQQQLTAPSGHKAHERRFELAGIFAGQPWIGAWVAGELARGGVDVRLLELLDPDAMCSVLSGSQSARIRVDKHLAPLVEAYGVDALPAVSLALSHPALCTEALGLMARFVHPDAFDALTRHSTLEGARMLLLSEPGWALYAFARQPGSGSPPALAMELARVASLVDAVLPHLDGVAAKRLHRWAQRAEPVSVAIRTWVRDVPPFLLEEPEERISWLKPKKLPLMEHPDGRTWQRAQLPRMVELLAQGVAATQLRNHVTEASLVALAIEVEAQWAASREPDRIFGRERFTSHIDDEEHGTRRWVRNRGVPDEVELPWPHRAMSALGLPGLADVLANRAIGWSKAKGLYRELVSLVVDEICSLPGDDAMDALDRIYKRVPRSRVRIDLYRAKIARAKGMTLHELKATELPDLGHVDAVVLDFGPRCFTLHADAALKPYLVDEQGQRLSRMPSARKSDDPAKVADAKAQLKAFRASARKTASTLKSTLEASLRMKKAGFQHGVFFDNLARHPVAAHFIASFVWRCGEVLFRVDESGEAVDVDDEPVDVEGIVRLAHPLDLSESQRQAWLELFNSYDILQSIPQLTRATFERPAIDTHGVARLRQCSIPSGGLFALKAKGWRWEYTADPYNPEERGLSSLSTTLRGVSMALVGTEPIDPMAGDSLEVARLNTTQGWEGADPIAYSEAVRDVLRASGAAVD